MRNWLKKHLCLHLITTSRRLLGIRMNALVMDLICTLKNHTLSAMTQIRAVAIWHRIRLFQVNHGGSWVARRSCRKI